MASMGVAARPRRGLESGVSMLLAEAQKSRIDVLSGDLRCLACGKALADYRTLAQHLKDAHGGRNEPQASADKPAGRGSGSAAASFSIADLLAAKLQRTEAADKPVPAATAPPREADQHRRGVHGTLKLNMTAGVSTEEAVLAGTERSNATRKRPTTVKRAVLRQRADNALADAQAAAAAAQEAATAAAAARDFVQQQHQAAVQAQMAASTDQPAVEAITQVQVLEFALAESARRLADATAAAEAAEKDVEEAAAERARVWKLPETEQREAEQPDTAEDAANEHLHEAAPRDEQADTHADAAAAIPATDSAFHEATAAATEGGDSRATEPCPQNDAAPEANPEEGAADSEGGCDSSDDSDSDGSDDEHLAGFQDVLSTWATAAAVPKAPRRKQQSVARQQQRQQQQQQPQSADRNAQPADAGMNAAIGTSAAAATPFQGAPQAATTTITKAGNRPTGAQRQDATDAAQAASEGSAKAGKAKDSGSNSSNGGSVSVRPPQPFADVAGTPDWLTAGSSDDETEPHPHPSSIAEAPRTPSLESDPRGPTRMLLPVCSPVAVAASPAAVLSPASSTAAMAAAQVSPRLAVPGRASPALAEARVPTEPLLRHVDDGACATSGRQNLASPVAGSGSTLPELTVEPEELAEAAKEAATARAAVLQSKLQATASEWHPPVQGASSPGPATPLPPAAAAAPPSGTGGGGTFPCDLCGVIISGEANLAQHIASSRHLRRAAATARSITAAATVAAGGSDAAIDQQQAAPGQQPSQQQVQQQQANVNGTPQLPIGDYCHQVISEELDRCAAQLLHQLLQWQERARAVRDARSAQRVAPKKRLVSGLREVAKWVRVGKARAVLVAPNIEPVDGEQGLSTLLATILADARKGSIPVVFALSRKRMGQIFGWSKKMSAIALLDINGAEPAFAELVQLAESGRAAWVEQNPELAAEEAAAQPQGNAGQASAAPTEAPLQRLRRDGRPVAGPPPAPTASAAASGPAAAAAASRNAFAAAAAQPAAGRGTARHSFPVNAVYGSLRSQQQPPVDQGLVDPQRLAEALSAAGVAPTLQQRLTAFAGPASAAAASADAHGRLFAHGIPERPPVGNLPGGRGVGRLSYDAAAMLQCMPDGYTDKYRRGASAAAAGGFGGGGGSSGARNNFGPATSQRLSSSALPFGSGGSLPAPLQGRPTMSHAALLEQHLRTQRQAAERQALLTSFKQQQQESAQVDARLLRQAVEAQQLRRAQEAGAGASAMPPAARPPNRSRRASMPVFSSNPPLSGWLADTSQPWAPPPVKGFASHDGGGGGGFDPGSGRGFNAMAGSFQDGGSISGSSPAADFSAFRNDIDTSAIVAAAAAAAVEATLGGGHSRSLLAEGRHWSAPTLPPHFEHADDRHAAAARPADQLQPSTWRSTSLSHASSFHDALQQQQQQQQQQLAADILRLSHQDEAAGGSAGAAASGGWLAQPLERQWSGQLEADIGAAAAAASRGSSPLSQADSHTHVSAGGSSEQQMAPHLRTAEHAAQQVAHRLSSTDERVALGGARRCSLPGSIGSATSSRRGSLLRPQEAMSAAYLSDAPTSASPQQPGSYSSAAGSHLDSAYGGRSSVELQQTASQFASYGVGGGGIAGSSGQQEPEPGATCGLLSSSHALAAGSAEFDAMLRPGIQALLQHSGGGLPESSGVGNLWQTYSAPGPHARHSSPMTQHHIGSADAVDVTMPLSFQPAASAAAAASVFSCRRTSSPPGAYMQSFQTAASAAARTGSHRRISSPPGPVGVSRLSIGSPAHSSYQEAAGLGHADDAHGFELAQQQLLQESLGGLWRDAAPPSAAEVYASNDTGSSHVDVGSGFGATMQTSRLPSRLNPFMEHAGEYDQAMMQ